MQDSTANLNSSIIRLRGVGPAIQRRLKNLGIETVQDVLFHLPNRYIDRTRISPIGSSRAGELVLVQGIIELTQIGYGRRRSLLCRVSDGSGALLLRFFHFTEWQKSALVKGRHIRCWGRLRQGKGTMEMAHPEYRIIEDPEQEELEDRLTPVYPATDGVSQYRLRQISDQALVILDYDRTVLPELLPGNIRTKYDFPTLAESLFYVHRPPVNANTDELVAGIHHTQKRLAFEELLAHHLSLRKLRSLIRAHSSHTIAHADPGMVGEFMHHLGFELTAAQDRVIEEIASDMAGNAPMLRLVQGDVGSGKTVVAAVSALHVLAAGLKVVIMAPTEILSDQHYYNIRQWFSGMDVPVHQLAAKQQSADREITLEILAAELPAIVIGTHSLFQESVRMDGLGLVIIDEQHRFGVSQRLALLEKGMAKRTYPHQIIMTATPIPRTLAMTVFAELDISVIDELPPGRTAVKTTVLSNSRRNEVIERINDVTGRGKQVYWVCTQIESSDSVQIEAAVEITEQLQESLPNLDIVLLHGKMKATEKEMIMDRFKQGSIDLLVATTVIEVGVDVPNASLMVIENAERLGLSQLHQLRGRVGRGGQESFCVLLYQEPLSEQARIRLETMRNTTDGFEIARKDLQLRGPGEIHGVRQAGLPQLKVADIFRDADLIQETVQSADDILLRHPEVADLLIKRWLNNAGEYGKV